MPAILTTSLTRSYGPRRGIESVSLEVPEGSRFGFLGPNGAGKTTTIRVLLGFLRAGRGRATVLGLDCWRDSARIKRDVGYVPGDLRLYPWWTGESALRTIGAIRGIDVLTPGKKLAERYQLDLSVRVRAMSRGMRQKLGLILAMAHNPRLLVLDEPTSGLDPLTQESFRAHLRELAGNGSTIFFSSHMLAEVEHVCDRVAIVREGRLVACDTLAGLQERAGHELLIRWKTAADAATLPPPMLRVHTRDALTWRASLTGPVAPVIAWLANKPIDDLEIARPDLESLFRRFYEREPTGPPTKAPRAPGEPTP